MLYKKDNSSYKNNGLGLEIWEYFDYNNPYPIDGAICVFNNGTTNMKKNSGFYELIYILEGCIYVIYKNGKEILVKEGDIFLIEPNIFHEIKTSYAKVFISCTPPFNFKNIELEK